VKDAEHSEAWLQGHWDGLNDRGHSPRACRELCDVVEYRDGYGEAARFRARARR
jgi:hypothetical protein